jgi:hypothetical protein
MKNQGREDYLFDAELASKEAAEKDKEKEKSSQRWYQRICDFMKANSIDPPYVGRPKGKGIRLDFYVSNQFPDMALEIKEASKSFKNTNDIHRAAHYIGMYIIRERELSGMVGGFLSKMRANLEPLHVEAHLKAEIRQEFQIHFEQYCLGTIQEERLEWAKRSILDSISCPNIKEWAEYEFDSLIANSTDEYRRIANRNSAQKYREKKKEVKLSVVGRGD